MHWRVNKLYYYVASSVSGQDKSTRAGKMELFCPLGTTRRVPQEKFPWKLFNKSFVDQVCSLKMASFFFYEFKDLDHVSVHKLTKNELDHYPAV